ncbi:Two-component response regulator Orr23 [Orobanche hederae]
MSEEVNSYDNFPVGMRVLAVDEDPIRLKLIEGLLLKCQYSVSTTNQAIVALYKLRENQDRFDLVITEVHLPDMDGFKLLELIELETDLPVITIESRDVHGWSSDGESQQNTNPNPQQPPTTLQIVLFVLLP